MLNHNRIARMKSDFPFLARTASQAYALSRSLANRKVCGKSQARNFNGQFLNAVTSEPISPEFVITELGEGKLILAKSFLQNTGLVDDTIDIFESTYGIPFNNLSRIHERLSVDEILSLTEKLKSSPDLLKLECDILLTLFSNCRDLYAELMPNLRPHVPYEKVRGQEEEIESRVGRGKMNAHGPHKDSWRFHPSNTINVWLALSDVTPLNGMMVVPHTSAYSPKFSRNEILPECATYPERQYVTTMDVGDILLFRAELLHGSILNQTKQTRFALSMRCTTDLPDFHRDFMYNYVRLKPSFSNLNRTKIAPRTSFSPASSELFFAEFGPQDRPLWPLSSESNGELLVRTDEGEKSFCARCPHQGAPLRNGRLENGKIVCPQHQLRVPPN